MKCTYCGSYNVVVNGDGELVCRDCATVHGAVYYVPAVRGHSHSASGRVWSLCMSMDLPFGLCRHAERIAVDDTPEAALAAVIHASLERGSPIPMSRALEMARRLGRDRFGNVVSLLASTLRRGLRERVRMYAVSAIRRLAVPNAYLVVHTLDEMLASLDMRKVQGRNPRVVAGALVELACEAVGVHVDRGELARALGISRHTIRGNVRILKKLVALRERPLV